MLINPRYYTKKVGVGLSLKYGVVQSAKRKFNLGIGQYLDGLLLTTSYRFLMRG